ncbi:DUF3861 domain-containing protein [Acinetobacter variabilis]|uniref:DUF3861 domain-containing protein n=1 Tax=Acinetobacter variabilis TaxID=70346 RepID=A0A7T8AQ92_9GAMM|nr:DUF3861 domain-containing protein [Acinetobacter variabilis]QQN88916.1 DUF3861 domain-containing protein [Acinetobacter variabilis]
MKQHLYEVNVQHLADTQGNPSTYSEALQFQVGNHDDIFKILEKLQASQLLDEESTKALVIGLKLFSEVMLENKELPLFKEFMPQFAQFMKSLKQTVKAQSEEQ